jgi:hypothetical protein
MKVAKKLNLEAADRAFATANTPLFLVRKLRADNATASIAASNSSREIFQELRAVLSTKATDFRTSVMPYVLLVALSLKSDNELLNKTADLPAPNHSWFKYCSEYLIESFQSNSIHHVMPKSKVTKRPTKRSNRTNAIVINRV